MKKKDEEKRPYYVFYRSFWDAIRELDDGPRLQLYDAISAYSLEDEEPDWGAGDALPKMLFGLMQPIMDKCMKRWLAGKKGGAPKGNKNARKRHSREKENEVVEHVENMVLEDGKTEEKTTKKQPKNNQKTTKKQPVVDNIIIQDKEYYLHASDNISQYQIGKSEDFPQEEEKEKKEAWKNYCERFVTTLNAELERNRSAIKPIVKLTDRREELIRVLLDNYTMEEIAKGVRNMARNPYANGRTARRDRPVTLDWALSRENFVKAIENNYDN